MLRKFPRREARCCLPPPSRRRRPWSSGCGSEGASVRNAKLSLPLPLTSSHAVTGRSSSASMAATCSSTMAEAVLGLSDLASRSKTKISKNHFQFDDRLPCPRSVGELSPRHRRRGKRRSVSLGRSGSLLVFLVQGVKCHRHLGDHVPRVCKSPWRVYRLPRLPCRRCEPPEVGSREGLPREGRQPAHAGR